VHGSTSPCSENNSTAASAPGRSLTLAPVPPRVVLAGYLEFLILQDGDGTERLVGYGPVISIAVPLGSLAPSRPSAPTTWRWPSTTPARPAAGRR
jgi:hypothetical protein